MSISRLNFKPDPNLLQTLRTEADFIKVEKDTIPISRTTDKLEAHTQLAMQHLAIYPVLFLQDFANLIHASTSTASTPAPQNLLPPRLPNHPHRHWQPHSLGKEEKRLTVRRWFGDAREKERTRNGEARSVEYRNTFCTITITMTITMNRTDEKGSLSDSLCINCRLVNFRNF